jgi:fructose-1,6-bisphosphatase/inositol monophosphatase family enzyme
MLQDFLRFAETTAREAGVLTMEYFLTDSARPEFKADDTPVTVADRRAEELIRRRIGESFPGHEIVGEEFGATSGGSDYRWIIDPIDGTKSFTHGVPLYGVLLALEIRGTVEVGCAHFPALGETIAAATGCGSGFKKRSTITRDGATPTDICSLPPAVPRSCLIRSWRCGTAVPSRRFSGKPGAISETGRVTRDASTAARRSPRTRR